MSKKNAKLMGHLLRRELDALWRARALGLLGALTLTALSLLTMILTFGTRPRTGSALLESFFYVHFGVSMILSVLISMRTFSEPFARGTWSILANSPTPSWMIVTTRWASCALTAFTIALCGSPIAAFIAFEGAVPVGHILAGYLGIALMQNASIAIGMLFSSMTSRQILAATLSATTLLLLTSTWLLADIAPPPLDTFLIHTGFFDGNFTGFKAGRITLSEATYYLGLCVVTLLCTTHLIDARRHI